MIALELAVQDLDGVDIAARVGVDRIELCAALAVGGLTPSIALIEAAAEAIPAHVLVRPRAGGFEYGADEAALIERDVRAALAAGASGVVIGATREGRVDVPLVTRLVDAAAGAPVTFHRAFDTIADRRTGLEALVDAGVSRVLTSAGRATAAEAVDELTALASQAAGRIEVMAGGGITELTAPLLLASGVDAIHASAKRLTAGVGISLGSAGDAARETTDEVKARALRSLVDAANA